MAFDLIDCRDLQRYIYIYFISELVNFREWWVKHVKDGFVELLNFLSLCIKRDAWVNVDI